MLLLSRCSLLLLLALLLLEHLTLPGGRLTNGLDTLGTLSRLVHVSALEDALHNLARIDMGKRMLTDLLVDTHGLGRCVGVVRQRDKGRRAVVHCVGSAPRKSRQIGLCRRKRRAKHDGINVLQQDMSAHEKTSMNGSLSRDSFTLHCSTQRPRS